MAKTKKYLFSPWERIRKKRGRNTSPGTVTIPMIIGMGRPNHAEGFQSGLDIKIHVLRELIAIQRERYRPNHKLYYTIVASRLKTTSDVIEDIVNDLRFAYDEPTVNDTPDKERGELYGSRVLYSLFELYLSLSDPKKRGKRWEPRNIPNDRKQFLDGHKDGKKLPGSSAAHSTMTYETSTSGNTAINPNTNISTATKINITDINMCTSTVTTPFNTDISTVTNNTNTATNKDNTDISTVTNTSNTNTATNTQNTDIRTVTNTCNINELCSGTSTRQTISVADCKNARYRICKAKKYEKWSPEELSRAPKKHKKKKSRKEKKKKSRKEKQQKKENQKRVQAVTVAATQMAPTVVAPTVPVAMAPSIQVAPQMPLIPVVVQVIGAPSIIPLSVAQQLILPIQFCQLAMQLGLAPASVGQAAPTMKVLPQTAPAPTINVVPQMATAPTINVVPQMATASTINVVPQMATASTSTFPSSGNHFVSSRPFVFREQELQQPSPVSQGRDATEKDSRDLPLKNNEPQRNFTEKEQKELQKIDEENRLLLNIFSELRNLRTNIMPAFKNNVLSSNGT